MTSNADIGKKLDEFREAYERDMRGDKKLNNGERGVIGEIREIKEYLKKYPSITWLFANKPLATIGAVLGVFIVLQALATAGLISWVAPLLGITVP